MNLKDFRASLRNRNHRFADTLAFIAANYDYTPSRFINGAVENAAGENEGSCKTLGLALLEQFTTEEALLAFGEHYRSVLANPAGDDHRNIRALMDTGLPGVRFDAERGRVGSDLVSVGQQDVRVGDGEQRAGEFGEGCAGEFGDLALAYAISIHKSQGSEYPVVIVPLLKAHFMMLQRNLLYTAITRAVDAVTVIGTPEDMAAVQRGQATRPIGVPRPAPTTPLGAAPLVPPTP